MNHKDNDGSQLRNLELLVSQSIDQQELLVKQVIELSSQIGQLQQKVIGLEDNLTTIKVDSRAIDLKAVKAEISHGIFKVTQTLTQQPKSVIRKIQILLFPPQDAKLFYKIVFGRWLMWLTLIAGIMYLYRFGVHWNNNHTTVKVNQLNNNHIVHAWQELYNRSGKKLRQEMDTILLKAILQLPVDTTNNWSNAKRPRASPRKPMQ